MKPFIVANWKMNPQTLAEAKELFNSVKRGVKNVKNVEVVICPPFVYLPLLKGITLCSPNCHWEQEGTYTGEVSLSMLKDIGCKYVIVGHSERRKYFNETDETVNKKLKAVLKEKLSPILCIGETQEQRERGEIEKILKKQLEVGLKNISGSRFRALGIIAYEPLWAISKGDPYKSKHCDAEEAEKMKLVIKKFISKIYNQNISKNAKIIYGGSANSQNAASYIKEAGLNGLLVGGASLKAEEFIKIIRKVS